MTETSQLDFDDTILEEPLEHPDWFEISLGDLREELVEARAAGKSGIMIYFGQARCAYCEKFLHINLADPEVEHYLRRHFDVVPIDIWGIEDIIDTDGREYSEREYALHYKANFTPTTLFYDRNGKPVYRLRGYYPVYQFQAALHYVVEGFYLVESFRDYLARAEPDLFFTDGELIERDFFATPPHDLRPSARGAERPLAVIFERGNCHACDLLHTGPLSRAEILHELAKMHVVQLGMFADTPVVTPAGVATTARDWARELGLFYTPSIVLFTPAGDEIMRLDSVVQFYRLWGALDYVNKRAYELGIDYQAWRLKQRETAN